MVAEEEEKWEEEKKKTVGQAAIIPIQSRSFDPILALVNEREIYVL